MDINPIFQPLVAVLWYLGVCRGQVLRFAPALPFRCNRLSLSGLN